MTAELSEQADPSASAAKVICIGSVLWDVIGRSQIHMRVGTDVAGRITRIPGGVALNIAMTLRRFGLRPTLLTAVGRDREGEELILEVERMGIECAHVYRSDDLPTDVYMAVEGANGLIAAIADAHSLEAAGEKILHPYRAGSLPNDSVVVLDGNLTTGLLAEIANDPLFQDRDIRVAPASPGKAERLLTLMGHPSATFYVNLEEAGLLCQTTFDSSEEAAFAVHKRGAHRVLVTNGDRSASECSGKDVLTLTPPSVLVTRVTGAGDTFLAAHMASELQGLDRRKSFERALQSAANYVSGAAAT